MATRHAGGAVIPVTMSFLKSMMDFQQHQLPDGKTQYSHCWLNDRHKLFLLPLLRCCQQWHLVQPKFLPFILQVSSRQPKDECQPISRFTQSHGPTQILLMLHVPLLSAAEACNGRSSCIVAWPSMIVSPALLLAAWVV